jgi:NTP pyrophosphatase (non-canonical NTP hydrolase)
MNDIELNIIHDIEELAELQKELTKALRGKLRLLKLEEEMADVFISLYNIIDLFNLDLKNIQLIMRCKKDVNK